MMKQYYGNMTDWIQKQQSKNREDELEAVFMNELAEFTHFWEETMNRFRQVSEEEMASLLVKNKDLSNEVSS
jgi:signal transduction histidine kinase